MMNYIWVALVVIAVVAGGVTGNMQGILDNLFEFAETAVTLAIGLIGIMAFFLRTDEGHGKSRSLRKAG